MWEGVPLGVRQGRTGAVRGTPSLNVSHNGAAVPTQGPLEADGGVDVLATGTPHALEEFTEKQEDVPVVLGRALDVAALPGLFHQVGDVPAGDDPAFLEVPLVPHDNDGGVRGADDPVRRSRGE